MHDSTPTPRTLDAQETSTLLKEQALKDRLAPQPGAKLYLHLSDLRRQLDAVVTDAKICILDFGCGGSPYRSLFPNADYRRADLGGMEGLDYIITPGQPLDVPAHTFDLIMSTQVLEHVPDFGAYLLECHRVLKPGGRLVLTTHGTFPDHGAPWDFQRWTPYGLARDIQKAGFEVVDHVRMTTGPRAVLQLWELNMERMSCKGGLFGFVFRVLRGLTRRRRAAFHRWADENLASYRIASALDAPEHRLYLGLMVQARAV